MNLIDGKMVATVTKEKMSKEVTILKEKTGKNIGLAVVLVGNNQASEVYVRNKINSCKEVGLKSYLVRKGNEATTEEILSVVEELNADENIHGVMVQLPMPKQIDESKILRAIDPNKDVDGCHYVQKGKLWIGEPELIACTPLGIIRLLEYYNIPLEGKNAVVVGRSNLVGKPLAQLLLDKNATVTICHSRTKNLGDITKNADIVCVAIGIAKFLKADMVKEGAIVIDVGMDRDENGKLCGDVDFENVAPKCSYITPVPKGVGPMTVTMLISNTITAFKIKNNI